MNILLSIKTRFVLLIALNLLVSVACVWMFLRMAPALNLVELRNRKSINASEKMLSAIAEHTTGFPRLNDFKEALAAAEHNITEPGEKEAIGEIKKYYPKAFDGDHDAKALAMAGLRSLIHCNTTAMKKTADDVLSLGSAGAWGMVFLSLTTLTLILSLLHSIVKELLTPLKEIDDVLDARIHGDRFRRCSGIHPSGLVRTVYQNLNHVLDER